MPPLPVRLRHVSGREGTVLWGSRRPRPWGLWVEAKALFLVSPGPWSVVFSFSHKDTAAKITATAQRALRASNASYTLLWRLVEGSMALEAQRELEDR